jgi:hypothetical protein
MKWLGSSLFWGLVLIVAGILFLLQTFRVIPGGDIFAALALTAAGVLFLSVFVGNRANWWALIPGIILLSIAANIVVDAFLPGVAHLSGAIILGGIGLSFAAVYLVNRQNWWAIIPAGVMFTVAIMSVVEPALEKKLDTGGIFFVGLGLTFILVALLPTPHGQMKWAYIPAVVLLLMGLLVLASSAQLINYVWPAALILIGALLLLRAFRRKL